MAKTARPIRLKLEPLEPRLALAGDSTVVFNEIMYNPAAADQGLEWVELYNQMAVDVDLSGWRLDGAVDFQFDAGTVIPGGGHLVVAKDPGRLQTETGFAGAFGPFDGQLSNGGERIELLGNSGRTMDEVDYDDQGRWPVGPDGSGASLAKMAPFSSGAVAENWASSGHLGGTPGTDNFLDPADPAEIDLALNEIAAGGATQFYLELANYGHASIQLAGYVIAASWGGLYTFPARVIAPGAMVWVTEAELGFRAAADNRLFLYAPQLDYVVDAVRVQDVLQGRSPDGTGRWLFPDVPTPAAANHFEKHDEVVINEIMYHHSPTPETAAVVEETQPVVIDATWKYEQSNVFPGAGWNSPGFDDGGWPSGDGVLFAGPLSGTPNPVPTAIPTLFNTGIGTSGQVVADGQPDPHYRLTLSAEAVPPPPDVPATVISNHPAWIANNAQSKWLGPVHPGTTNVAAGDYVFETTFDLTGFVPGTASVSMRISADNTLTDVLLNGEGTGITYAGFGGFSPVRTIDAGFVAGENTLEFVLNNAGAGANPAGLRLELSGTALPIPAGTELDLGPAAYYFRTDFQFGGCPSEGQPGCPSDGMAATQLELVPFVDDGAVFYLNGEEVYRHNMPDGPILHTTRAADEVSGQATFDRPMTIPSDALVAGRNVLAVEVHQAQGGFEDMAFGAELRATQTLVEGSPFIEDPQEWIELYNRSAGPVDLSGWRLEDAVGYAFQPGTTIEPGAYLVVARDADALRQQYPGIDVVGNYTRRLGNFDDRLLLLDEHGNPADEVHYFEAGRWPQFADGGGSSLELRDPRADNSAAEAWAASDESAESQWQTVTYRGPANEPPGSNNPSHFNELIFGLLDAGEILIDDLSVVEDPDGANRELIQNGSFDAGTNTWRILGNHADHGLTRLADDPDEPGNKVLHLTATGATEHMHNHVETTFSGNRAVQSGLEYEVSYRARWLTGSNQVNTRLYFNRLARTTLLDVPQQNGTPGGRNSTWAANAGPTYADLGHTPVMPGSGQSVVVSVTAADPDGVAAMRLKYSVNGRSWRTVAMAAADGRFTGTVPGQSSASVVQFYVEGTDAAGASSTFPAAGADSRALYTVNDGLAGGGPHHDFRLIMTAADVAFQFGGPGTSNALSNHRRGATVVFDRSEVYYDVGVRLKGSGYSRGSSRTGYNVRFDPDRLFHGVHDIVAVDRTASAYGVGASHRELVVKHIATHAGDIPGMYDDLIYFIPPKGSVAATTAQLMLSRYDDAFLDSSFANGSDGTRFKFELIYYPTNTVDGNPQSLKPKPNTVLGVDIQNMGDDKEGYRWNHLIKNKRARDDYSRIIELGKTFSLSGSTNGGQLDVRSQAVMDVDQWLRNFAFESLAGINDTYNQGLPHNLQVFVRPEDDRVVVLPWDMDFAFHHSTSMSVFGTGSNFRKIINVPNNLHHYYGHLHDIINTTYNTAYLADWVDHYARFAQRNVTGEILNYINNRRSFVLGRLPGQVGFTVTTNGGNPFSVDDVLVTIEGRGWINVREIRLAGSSDPLEVTWTDVDRWRVTLPIAPGENSLSFQAFDFQGNLLAADAITVTSTVPQRPLQEHLRITELGYNPADPTPQEIAGGFLNNDDFEFVELQNIGPEVLDLSGVQFAQGIEFEFTGAHQGPPVVITEAGTGTSDYVEIQNVSGATVDTAGWLVVVNNADDIGHPPDINAWHATVWALPEVIGPDQVLYRTDIDDGSGNLWGENIFWRTDGPGWVMLVDDAGAPADFVVWGYSAEEIASLAVDLPAAVVTVATAWTPPAVPPDGVAGSSLKRLGDHDHNHAADWAFSQGQSAGQTNAGLTVPFPPGSFELAPGQLTVIVRNAAAFEARYGTAVKPAASYARNLANGGERVTLVDPDLGVIADFRYGDSTAQDWPNRPDGMGSSLELIDPAAVPPSGPQRTAYLEDGNHWRSSSEYGGSPGTLGTGFVGDVVVNEVLSHTDPPLVDVIELHNTTGGEIDVGGWYLSDAWGWETDADNGNYKKFRIAAGTVIPAGGYAVFDEADFNASGGVDPELHPNDFALDGAHGDDAWLMQADPDGKLLRFADHVELAAQAQGESWGRWPNGSGRLYPMRWRTLDKQRPEDGQNSGPRVGPVVFSEVHYNPDAGLADDDLEFVEIYNNTAEAVNLKDWRIRGDVDFDFPEGTTVEAYSPLLIVPFDPADDAKLTAFRLRYGIDESVGLIGGYTDRLGDDGGRIELQRPDDEPEDEPGFIPRLLEDEVRYGDRPPWPGEPDGGGHSLGRLAPDAWGNAPENWQAATPTPGATDYVPLPPAEVVDRRVFYNDSTFDGNDAAANAGDDAAIAPDKVALLPGQTATSANYTGYSRGLSGIIIDVDGLRQPAVLTVDDFRFRVGNDNDPEGWAAAPGPASVSVRPEQGIADSDRVTLIWADGAIAGQWLQVTVLATATTRLNENDVFYFGNAIGECGNSTVDAKVGAIDMLGARDNQRGFLDPAPIDFAFDYNRDARVNTIDMLIARNNQTHFLNALRLITVPSGKGGPQDSMALQHGPAHDAAVSLVADGSERRSAPLGRLDWLSEYESPVAKRQDSAQHGRSSETPDKLLAAD